MKGCPYTSEMVGTTFFILPPTCGTLSVRMLACSATS